MKAINYPENVNWDDDFEYNLWLDLKAEYGARGLDEKVAELKAIMREKLDELIALPIDEELAKAEPNDLERIRALRPPGRRRIWADLPHDIYLERLRGALLGRCAGCLLGAPVENWKLPKMRAWAEYLGDDFPPTDYWSAVERPYDLKEYTIPRDAFARDKMDGAPPDDDLIYTLLGLLILEEYGPDFSIADVGAAFLKYVPWAYTAEGVTLRNLRAGIPAEEAGGLNNPFEQYLGADIRCDPWAYVAPGWPEKAAELAWRDAMLTHRRNGIYGAMYFAAAISAAFTIDDPVEALHIGLEEIPADCLLAREARWALGEADSIRDYQQANDMVQARYGNMSVVHTISNACLTIWGLARGGRDFTRVIGETVAMGYDNDCTAATAGSIAGATLGADGIPTHWTRNFNNKMFSYLTGQAQFAIDDVIARFARQAERVFAADS